MTTIVQRICDGCGATLPRPDGFPGLGLSGSVTVDQPGQPINVALDACSGSHLVVALGREFGSIPDDLAKLAAALGVPPYAEREGR